MYFLGSPEEGVGEADFHLALHGVVQSGVCQPVPCAQVFQLVWDLGLEKRVIKDFGEECKMIMDLTTSTILTRACQKLILVVLLDKKSPLVWSSPSMSYSRMADWSTPDFQVY